jgi:hypothetical protein
VGHGIAPSVLFSEVRGTAAWALVPGYTRASYQSALLRLQDPPDDWSAPSQRVDHFRSLVAAHFTTCATFCPTDVDNRIRFHVWQEANNDDELEALYAVACEAARWPVPEVSSRFVKVDAAPEEAFCHGGVLSGHAGEWFSVFAGALGRAHELSHESLATKIRARIEAELAYEAAMLRVLSKAQGRELDALRAVAAVAHNLGDLARVVEAWPKKTGKAAGDVARYTALPKTPAEPFGALFVALGDIYKDMLADSNHRYLSLRAAKTLRTRHDFLLPTGPFFDAWGSHIAKHCEDPASVLAALLEGHAASPTERGFLRAIAGMNQHKGGVDALERDIPARLRKTLRTPPVRQALDLDARRFEERMRARFVSTHRPKLR